MPRRERKNRLHRSVVVREIANVLASGRSSSYEFEGACVAGLRRVRCLSGSPWANADHYARLVVSLALVRIGATAKPFLRGRIDTWHTTHERCQNHTCGKPLDDGQWRYCSQHCSDVVRMRNYRRDAQAYVDASRAAFLAARATGEELTRTCAHEPCGRSFAVQPHWGGLKQKYCSTACADAARRKYERRTCELPGCDATFQPRSAKQRFCSPDHAALAATKPREARTCERCGQPFYPAFPSRPTRRCEDCRAGAARATITCEAVE